MILTCALAGPFVAIRPEGGIEPAGRKIDPRELSIDLVADERPGRPGDRQGWSLVTKVALYQIPEAVTSGQRIPESASV